MKNTDTTEIGIVCWNILFDKENYFNVPSQFDRKESFIQSLGELGIPLDVIGLLEAQNDPEHGNIGQLVAQATANTAGFWSANNRDDEQLGLFGDKISAVREFDLEGKRRGLLATLSDVDIALVHLKYDPLGERLRLRQMKQALEKLKDSDRAILMGDFNSASWQRSRRLAKNAGFMSVFRALGRKRPSTVPTDAYHKRLTAPYRLASRRGFAPDDIYVKNVEVIDAGVLEGDSDHRGVWARLRV